MKYYALTYSINSKVIGIKDGTQQAKIEESWFPIGEYERFENFFYKGGRKDLCQFPDFDIHMTYIRLKKGAYLTDFVSLVPPIPGGQFLINDKVVDLILEFNFPPYKLYPVSIDHLGKRYDNYYFFLCPLIGYEIINFAETVIYEGSVILGKTYKKYNDYNDFLEIGDSLLKAETIVLNDNFDRKLDYFDTYLSPYSYVSARLKKEIEDRKLTGVTIKEFFEPEIIV